MLQSLPAMLCAAAASMLDASTDREDPWTLTRCSGWAAVANQDGLVGWITRRLLEAELRAPKYHALARHPLAER
jgi:hypothetical protein